MESQVVAHLLNGSTVSLEVRKPTINDIRVRISQCFPQILPSEVTVLTYPGACEIDSRLDDEVLPPEVFTIFDQGDRAEGGSIWTEAFTAFAEAGDVCGMKRTFPKLGRAFDNPARHAFYDAAVAGNVDVVKMHLDAGVDWEDAIYRGRWTTLLNICAENGAGEIMRLLLDRGWDIERADPYDQTALFVGAKYDRSDVVAMLLERGATSRANARGETPLHAAAQRGNLTIVQLLLQYGADKVPVDEHGRSPLYVAQMFGEYAIAKLLHEDGAELRKYSRVSGRTGLYLWHKTREYLGLPSE